MRVWVLVLVIACKRDAAPVEEHVGSAEPVVALRAAAVVSPVRLVTTLGSAAQLIDIGVTAKVTATIALPSSAYRIAWVDRDPIALLVGQMWGEHSDDPKFDGTVGAITPAGFKPLPALPPTTWTIPKPANEDHLDHVYWDLAAPANGEAWLGRCEWGGIQDGGHCDVWVWARLGGAFPLSLVSNAGPGSAEPRAWPTLAPPPNVTVTFAANGSDANLHTLTCRSGSASLTLPGSDPSDEGGAVEVDSLRWISTDPPMFYVVQGFPGFDWVERPTVVEGCAVSSTFTYPFGIAGPDGLLVLGGTGATSILRNGKELARVAGADHAAFAPDVPPVADTFLADFEKQLAGDTSSFARDAIVLAPGPVAVGAPLVPAGITRARIASFDSGHLGDDAAWFAAEVELVANGKLQTYRAVELYDTKASHVIVASFTPLKSLARGAAATVIPSPNAPGPLAQLLVTPNAAAAVLTENAVVFGTDPDEHAAWEDKSQALLGRWSKLALALDLAAVHEVHAASYGYAIASITLAKPGGAPYRMIALIIGALDKGAWQVAAIHYLAP